MTRRTTLFLVCAFEIALILFVVAWSAHAKETIVNCEGRYFKHQYSAFSSDVFIRKDGEWAKWCHCGGQLLMVTEDSAICETNKTPLCSASELPVISSGKTVLDLMAKKYTVLPLLKHQRTEIYGCVDVE